MASSPSSYSTPYGHEIETIKDPETERKTTEVLRFLREKGSIFRNHRGAAVAFDDLDRDLMCGLMTYYMRPVTDTTAFRRDMPRGRWSDNKSRSGPTAETRTQHLAAIESDERTVRNGNVGSGYCDFGDGAKGQGLDSSSALEKRRGSQAVASTALDHFASTVNGISGPSHANCGRNASPDRSLLYETVDYVHGAQITAMRQQPGVEKMLHSSKLRVEPLSRRVFNEFRSTGRTPYNDSPGLTPGGMLNSPERQAHPLTAWVKEGWVGR